MNWLLLPGVLGLVGCAAVLSAVLVHLRAAPGRDVGSHWARLVGLAAVAAGFVTVAAALAPLAREGGWWAPESVSNAVAWAILAAWLLAAVVSPFLSLEPRRGRWVVGRLGPHAGREWLLVPAALVAGLMLLTIALFREALSYDAWVTQACALCAFVGAALSPEPTRAAAADSAVSSPAPAALAPWPEQMREAGFDLRPLGVVDVDPGGRAPTVAAAVERFLDSSDERPVLGIRSPDHSGQLESMVAAARDMAARGRLTIVIVARDADRLCRLALHDAPPGLEARVIGRGTRLPPPGFLWFVEMEVLSGRLGDLMSREVIRRLGLLVYWNVHDYSGVLAANAWALSRRVRRLVGVHSESSLKTLVFARRMRHGGEQAQAFFRRMLPYDLGDGNTVDAATRSPISVRAHLLESHHRFLNTERARSLGTSELHPAVVAAGTSADLGYPTHLSEPVEATRDEVGAALQKLCGEHRLDVPPARADARIHEIGSADILATHEKVAVPASTGAARVQDVALVPVDSGYVRWHMRRLAAEGLGGRSPVSRRLVGAAGQDAIVERHLLLSLGELPAIREELLHATLFDEALVRRALDGLRRGGRLTVDLVRYIDPEGRFRTDHRYKSKQEPAAHQGSLRVVGTDTVVVRELGGSVADDGVRLVVDRARLAVAAYPERVFYEGGRRFVVGSGDLQPGEPPWIECRQQDRLVRTWRRRITGLNLRAPVRTRTDDIGSRRVARALVEVDYWEEVTGLVREVVSHTGASTVGSLGFGHNYKAAFPTRALLLDLGAGWKHAELASAAHALGLALPAHVGVEPDAVSVVPYGLEEGEIRSRYGSGVAIVDLFPGGIGLVDDVCDDGDLVRDILGWVALWTSGCPCASDQGCAECVRDPSAEAYKEHAEISRQGAVKVLGDFAAVASATRGSRP